MSLVNDLQVHSATDLSALQYIFHLHMAKCNFAVVTCCKGIRCCVCVWPASPFSQLPLQLHPARQRPDSGHVFFHPLHGSPDFRSLRRKGCCSSPLQLCLLLRLLLISLIGFDYCVWRFLVIGFLIFALPLPVLSPWFVCFCLQVWENWTSNKTKLYNIYYTIRNKSGDRRKGLQWQRQLKIIHTRLDLLQLMGTECIARFHINRKTVMFLCQLQAERLSSNNNNLCRYFSKSQVLCPSLQPDNSRGWLVMW